MSRWPFVVKRQVQVSLPPTEEVPFCALGDPAEVRELSDRRSEPSPLEGVLGEIRAQAGEAIDDIPDASLEQ